MTPSTHLIRTVFNINAVEYQTGPIHESDNHIFAEILGGGSGPPDPPPLWIRTWIYKEIIQQKTLKKKLDLNLDLDLIYMSKIWIEAKLT